MMDLSFQYGIGVDGVASISQSILNILSTIPGSSAFRPEFGCDIWSLLDQPTPRALASINAKIQSSIARWEPRVSNVIVTTEVDYDQIKCNISWSIGNSGVRGETLFLPKSFVNSQQTAPALNSDVVNPVVKPLLTRKDWSLGFNYGKIAQGFSEINQSILNILSTKKGSSPFRPDFGCDVWNFVSSPLNSAIPGLKYSIYKAIQRWEPRIRVRNITHSLYQEGQFTGVYSGVIFNIGYELAGGTTANEVEILIGNIDDQYNESVIVGEGFLIMILGSEGGDAIVTEDSKKIAI